jgi:hypothetical protein
MTRRALLAIFCLACGGPDMEGPAGGPQPPEMQPPQMLPMPRPPSEHPLGKEVTLRLEPFDVQPGTERQVCKRFNLPRDAPMEVVRLSSTMVGTSHHLNVYKVLGSGAAAPVDPSRAVVYDCPPAAEQLAGGAAYFYGASSPEKHFDTPPGVVFHMPPGQQIIVEHHVINASPRVMKGEASFTLTAIMPGGRVEHHADVMWMGNWYFYLPPRQRTSSTARCVFPYDVEVFGLWSHFHSLGVNFTMDKWTPQGRTRIYESQDWAHPVYLPKAPPLLIRAGEGIEWTCTWNNTRDRAVGPGRESTDEMCIAFGAGYPSKSLSEKPIQCNKFL